MRRRSWTGRVRPPHRRARQNLCRWTEAADRRGLAGATGRVAEMGFGRYREVSTGVAYFLTLPQRYPVIEGCVA